VKRLHRLSQGQNLGSGEGASQPITSLWISGERGPDQCRPSGNGGDGEESRLPSDLDGLRSISAAAVEGGVPIIYIEMLLSTKDEMERCCPFGTTSIETEGMPRVEPRSVGDLGGDEDRHIHPVP